MTAAGPGLAQSLRVARDARRPAGGGRFKLSGGGGLLSLSAATGASSGGALKLGERVTDASLGMLVRGMPRGSSVALTAWACEAPPRAARKQARRSPRAAQPQTRRGLQHEPPLVLHSRGRASTRLCSTRGGQSTRQHWPAAAVSRRRRARRPALASNPAQVRLRGVCPSRAADSLCGGTAGPPHPIGIRLLQSPFLPPQLLL